AIILSLFDTVHQRRPDYMAAFLGWEPVDNSPEAIARRFPEIGDRTRYGRALSMFLALLHEAGFPGGENQFVNLELHKPIRQRLAQNPDVRKFAQTENSGQGVPQVANRQRLPIAAQLYQRLWPIYDENRTDTTLFPTSARSGKAYFEGIHRSLLE